MSNIDPSEAAAALSRKRWKKTTKAQRAAVGAALAKARKAIDPDERSRLASQAASSISSEAARARALKAHATKRKKAAAAKKSLRRKSNNGKA